MGGKVLFHIQTSSEAALTNSCQTQRNDIKIRATYYNLFNTVFTLMHKDQMFNSIQTCGICQNTRYTQISGASWMGKNSTEKNNFKTKGMFNILGLKRAKYYFM